MFTLRVRKNQKADWRAIDSPKKRTDEFDLFAVKSKKANQTKGLIIVGPAPIAPVPFWVPNELDS